MINKDTDIAIVGGDILTMDPDQPIIRQGLILINNDRIEYCGNQLTPDQYDAKKTIQASGSVVLPPFFNQHTHPSVSLYRGLGADLRLNEWLEQVIWPLEKEFCHPDFVYLGTQLSLAEMILNGTGAAAIMDFHTASVGKAFLEAGMRGVIGEAIFSTPTPSCKTADEGFAYTESLLSTFGNNELLDIYVVIHAPFTSSPEIYSLAAEKAKEWDVMCTSHVAETKREVTWSNEKFGMSPVQLLESTGVLDTKFVLVHGVHLNDEDMNILKKHDVPVIHNPHSNMMLGSGICPVHQLIEMDIKVGLGTDSAASNNNLSMLREMQTAARLHKLSDFNAAELPAEQALKMATRTGYEIYGKSDIGVLGKGKKADLQIINLEQVHNTPHYGLASALVYSTHPEDIKTLIINGKIIMEDRELLTIHLPYIMKEVKKASVKIHSFMKNLNPGN
ncbi:MAG: amidohydrolase [Bacteroidales bacterium]|nr:amidohydrolase [Bacteroidales bacterium]